MNSVYSTLNSRHLMTLTLAVDFAGTLGIGAMAQGRRRIAPIIGGQFSGDRLAGTVLPGGADWVIYRPDGAMAIDVRITLKTDDEALIYCTYQGLFKADPEPMTRFMRGEILGDDEYRIRTIVKLETGAPRYQWLNDTFAIGLGQQTATGPIYTIQEVL